MPFTEHLAELRSRLIRSVIAVVVLFSGTFAIKRPLFRFLSRPLEQAFTIAQQMDPDLPDFAFKMAYKDPLEPFFTQLKVAVAAAFFLAVPYLTYQAWRFVAPGLYQHERRATVPFVLSATLMFAGGAAFGYLLVLPYGYGYLLTYGGEDFEPMIMMAEYLKLTARLLIAFGLVFELPVVVVFLARIGVVSPATLVRYRRHAIVVFFVLAAILTPPDVVTQVLLALPLVLLYELSILGAKVFGRPRPEADG